MSTISASSESTEPLCAFSRVGGLAFSVCIFQCYQEPLRRLIRQLRLSSPSAYRTVLVPLQVTELQSPSECLVAFSPSDVTDLQYQTK